MVLIKKSLQQNQSLFCFSSMERLELLKAFLDEKARLYNQLFFIESDPVQIPHLFQKQEDIEISGFLTATLAWGQRKTIINNALLLMKLMDNSPYDFIMTSGEKDLKPFEKYIHRTFNGDDCLFFMASLKNIYKNLGGLKQVFYNNYQKNNSIKEALVGFRQAFFEIPHLNRTQKHVSDIVKNASAKRLNMFLRWMVRKDANGVDFGIWDEINTRHLYIPLDVHTANTARKLGLLERTQNDWKAVVELTDKLRVFDFNDPVKYDYALFGVSVFEKNNLNLFNN